MSQPDPLGPIQSLFDGKGKLFEQMGWFVFDVSPRLRGRDAGRWAVENLPGTWTFEPAYDKVTFWVKDAKDAMLFKITWG